MIDEDSFGVSFLKPCMDQTGSLHTHESDLNLNVSSQMNYVSLSTKSNNLNFKHITNLNGLSNGNSKSKFIS